MHFPSTCCTVPKPSTISTPIDFYTHTHTHIHTLTSKPLAKRFRWRDAHTAGLNRSFHFLHARVTYTHARTHPTQTNRRVTSGGWERYNAGGEGGNTTFATIPTHNPSHNSLRTRIRPYGRPYFACPCPTLSPHNRRFGNFWLPPTRSIDFFFYFDDTFVLRVRGSAYLRSVV